MYKRLSINFYVFKSRAFALPVTGFSSMGSLSIMKSSSLGFHSVMECSFTAELPAF